MVARLPHLPAPWQSALRHVSNAGREIRTAGSQLWQAHETRMQGQPIYRAVVSAIAAVIARQMSFRRLLLAILTAVINSAARARTRRVHLSPFDEPDGWPYD